MEALDSLENEVNSVATEMFPIWHALTPNGISDMLDTPSRELDLEEWFPMTERAASLILSRGLYWGLTRTGFIGEELRKQERMRVEFGEGESGMSPADFAGETVAQFTAARGELPDSSEGFRVALSSAQSKVG